MTTQTICTANYTFRPYGFSSSSKISDVNQPCDKVMEYLLEIHRSETSSRDPEARKSPCDNSKERASDFVDIKVTKALVPNKLIELSVSRLNGPYEFHRFLQCVQTFKTPEHLEDKCQNTFSNYVWNKPKTTEQAL